jgi:hypothetical protein
MKTAVEWLVQEFDLEMQDTFNHKINQAKEMFEEQVTLSHINGQSEFDKGAISENTKKLATEYYNQTFKSE